MTAAWTIRNRRETAQQRAHSTSLSSLPDLSELLFNGETNRCGYLYSSCTNTENPQLHPWNLPPVTRTSLENYRADSTSSVAYLGRRVTREYRSAFRLGDDQTVGITRRETFHPEEARADVRVSLALQGPPDFRHYHRSLSEPTHLQRIGDSLGADRWAELMLTTNKPRDSELVARFGKNYSACLGEASNSARRRNIPQTNTEDYSLQWAVNSPLDSSVPPQQGLFNAQNHSPPSDTSYIAPNVRLSEANREIRPTLGEPRISEDGVFRQSGVYLSCFPATIGRCSSVGDYRIFDGDSRISSASANISPENMSRSISPTIDKNDQYMSSRGSYSEPDEFETIKRQPENSSNSLNITHMYVKGYPLSSSGLDILGCKPEEPFTERVEKETWSAPSRKQVTDAAASPVQLSNKCSSKDVSSSNAISSSLHDLCVKSQMPAPETDRSESILLVSRMSSRRSLLADDTFASISSVSMDVRRVGLSPSHFSRRKSLENGRNIICGKASATDFAKEGGSGGEARPSSAPSYLIEEMGWRLPLSEASIEVAIIAPDTLEDNGEYEYNNVFELPATSSTNGVAANSGTNLLGARSPLTDQESGFASRQLEGSNFDHNSIVADAPIFAGDWVENKPDQCGIVEQPQSPTAQSGDQAYWSSSKSPEPGIVLDVLEDKCLKPRKPRRIAVPKNELEEISDDKKGFSTDDATFSSPKIKHRVSPDNLATGSGDVLNQTRYHEGALKPLSDKSGSRGEDRLENLCPSISLLETRKGILSSPSAGQKLSDFIRYGGDGGYRPGNKQVELHVSGLERNVEHSVLSTDNHPEINNLSDDFASTRNDPRDFKPSAQWLGKHETPFPNQLHPSSRKTFLHQPSKRSPVFDVVETKPDARKRKPIVGGSFSSFEVADEDDYFDSQTSLTLNSLAESEVQEAEKRPQEVTGTSETNFSLPPKRRPHLSTNGRGGLDAEKPRNSGPGPISTEAPNQLPSKVKRRSPGDDRSGSDRDQLRTVSPDKDKEIWNKRKPIVAPTMNDHEALMQNDIASSSTTFQGPFDPRIDSDRIKDGDALRSDAEKRHRKVKQAGKEDADAEVTRMGQKAHEKAVERQLHHAHPIKSGRQRQPFESSEIGKLIVTKDGSTINKRAGAEGQGSRGSEGSGDGRFQRPVRRRRRTKDAGVTSEEEITGADDEEELRPPALKRDIEAEYFRNPDEPRHERLRPLRPRPDGGNAHYANLTDRERGDPRVKRQVYAEPRPLRTRDQNIPISEGGRSTQRDKDLPDSLVVCTRRRTMSGITGHMPQSVTHSSSSVWFADHPVPTRAQITAADSAPLRLSNIQLQAQAELARRRTARTHVSKGRSLEHLSTGNPRANSLERGLATSKSQLYGPTGRRIKGGAPFVERAIARKISKCDGYETLSVVSIPHLKKKRITEAASWESTQGPVNGRNDQRPAESVVALAAVDLAVNAFEAGEV